MNVCCHLVILTEGYVSTLLDHTYVHVTMDTVLERIICALVRQDATLSTVYKIRINISIINLIKYVTTLRLLSKLREKLIQLCICIYFTNTYRVCVHNYEK